MKGVVLAAGEGQRLRPLTLDTPKVLLKVGGRSLIEYSLDALGSAGISEVAVVLGYEADKVQDAVRAIAPGVTFLRNEHYRGGNALSLSVARDYVGDSPFVLCMGDHTISPEMVRLLLSSRRRGCILCIDQAAWHPSQLDDATRVLMDRSGDITAIGKRLKVWNAIDTGVFRMTADVFPAIDRLMEDQGLDVSLSSMVRWMGSNGRPFGVCDISGLFWADVDTREDYQAVGDLLKEQHGRRL